MPQRMTIKELYMKKEYIECSGLLATLALANYPLVDFEDAYEIVQNAIVSDVATVVHGEWVEGAENFTNGRYDAECNRCGTYISWNDGNSGDWNFCPNCGAKMDGGKLK